MRTSVITRARGVLVVSGVMASLAAGIALAPAASAQQMDCGSHYALIQWAAHNYMHSTGDAQDNWAEQFIYEADEARADGC
jgi:hypothetical protein